MYTSHSNNISPNSIPTRRSSDLTPLRSVEVTAVDDQQSHQVTQQLEGFATKGKQEYFDPAHPHRPLWRVSYYPQDRKSTRLNSSHVAISYAVFCLKKKKKTTNT